MRTQNYSKHPPGVILLSLGSHQPGLKFVEVLSKCCRRPPKKTSIKVTSRSPCIGHLTLVVHGSFSCTTIVVGRKATSDGSVLVTHSDDGESKADARLCLVPARDHDAGSRRNADCHLRNVYDWVTKV